MKPISFHPSAVVEADEAFDWYADYGIDVALEFKSTLNQTLDQIGLMPGRFPKYILSTQKAVFMKFPYLIVFRERMDDIQVIAVAHGRRRVGYWRSRL